MSRAPKQPLLHQKELKIPKEFLKFTTPRDVANYRADRLKCNVLVELGAGIGGQTIAFARKCKKVIAVEIDKERTSVLNQNLKKLNIKNVEVINGDALNKGVIQKIAKENPNIVFFDTERPEQSDRILENIKPPVNKILEAYLPLAKNIAIEIPPFTQGLEMLKNKFDFEEEFSSLNSQLNRLTLYFNSLKTCEKSVIALPSREKLIDSNKKFNAQEVLSAKNNTYLYAIDPAVVLAELVDEIAGKFNLAVLEMNKPVLLSDKQVKSYFLTGYKIVSICENKQEKILATLKNIGAGKVTLRYHLEPEDYWKERNFYEKKLTGKKEISLFINEKKNEAILCEKV